MSGGDELAEAQRRNAVLREVLAAHGGEWQITHDDEMGVWTAVRRPTPTAQDVIVAHDVDELARKLAETQEPPA
jgi:hypothetical protein